MAKRKRTKRSAADSDLVARSRWANVSGRTFKGRRDLYKAFGYSRELFCRDFRSRFLRSEVANRIVKAAPMATWRGGAELIEDEDPTTFTVFEQAFYDLDLRLKVWSTLRKADVLAGIGRYGIVFIGAPGETDQPLEKVSGPQDIIYLQCYAEDDVMVQKWVIDSTNPRFGLPEMYALVRVPISGQGQAAATPQLGKRVHWSRVIHVADGLLDDNVFGEPRLMPVWNRIDDLEKVVGGGSESFFRRADQGIQFDLDPTIDFDEDEVTGSTPQPAAKNMGLQKQLQDYEHGFRRFLLTRGIKINSIGSDVADFASPISAIMSLISAGTGIPQRVLMGSEQGKLAANQDRSNWEQRIEDRRVDYAGPLVVRTFIDRLIKIGALPTPAEGYEVRWPQLRVMDDKERAAIAQQWSMLNTNAKEVVVTANEIRDRVLQLPNLEEVQEAAKPTDIVTAEANLGERKLGAWAIKSARKILCLSAERKLYYRTKYARFKRHRKPLKKSVITTAAKGAAPGQNHIHEVADRFRVKATAVIKRAFANGKRVFGKPTTQAGMLSAASDAITRTEEGLRKTLLPILAQILATSGQAALDRIPKKTRQAADKPHVDIRFDQTNPDAVEWVKEHGAELIKGISDSTRQQVQDAIEAAFEDKDVDLTALAQEIGDIIGDDDGSRSDTIARTETMDASNAGQQEGWQQAVEAGLLNGDEKQVWIVTDDERLCPICEDFADATAALDENFESKSGEEADGPPAHPNCRCTVGLVAGGE